MVTSSNKLTIFESFRIDNSLPKFNQDKRLTVELDDSIPELDDRTQ